ncbi:hypothetical protein HOC37_07110 [bacterium]|nr:hypothetical protein [bacterium]MBT3582019.1 hypothetical protein [bacterium]MBT4552727.1 hypothetical protein [bacterium]MBT5988106.1 hypothetical protein [bacterium]MBT7087356.1 hypothetical protein [bacterium]
MSKNRRAEIQQEVQQIMAGVTAEKQVDNQTKKKVLDTFFGFLHKAVDGLYLKNLQVKPKQKRQHYKARVLLTDLVPPDLCLQVEKGVEKTEVKAGILVTRKPSVSIPKAKGIVLPGKVKEQVKIEKVRTAVPEAAKVIVDGDVAVKAKGVAVSEKAPKAIEGEMVKEVRTSKKEDVQDLETRFKERQKKAAELLSKEKENQQIDKGVI